MTQQDRIPDPFAAPPYLRVGHRQVGRIAARQRIRDDQATRNREDEVLV